MDTGPQKAVQEAEVVDRPGRKRPIIENRLVLFSSMLLVLASVGFVGENLVMFHGLGIGLLPQGQNGTLYSVIASAEEMFFTYGAIEAVFAVAVAAMYVRMRNAAPEARAKGFRVLLVMAFVAFFIFIALPGTLYGTTIAASMTASTMGAARGAVSSFVGAADRIAPGAVNPDYMLPGSGSSPQVVLLYAALNYIPYVLADIGTLLLFAVPIAALLRGNRRFLTRSAVAFIAIVAAASAASQYYVGYENSAAVQNLGSRIALYGAYTRSMLSNFTLFNASTGANRSVYNYMLNFSTPGGIYPLQENLSAPGTDINYFPGSGIIDSLSLEALSYLGVPISNGSVGNYAGASPLAIPGSRSVLENVYTLDSVGMDILLGAIVLNHSFMQGWFSVVHQGTGATRYLAIGTPACYSGESHMEITAVLQVPECAETVALAGIATGWAALVSAGSPSFLAVLGNAGNATFEHRISYNVTENASAEFSADRQFYAYSLSQYYGYFLEEILYNRTILPGVEFISYSDNGMVVDLGNINPAYTDAHVSVDGNALPYRKYFNFIVTPGAGLSAGVHTLTVEVPGYNLSQTVKFYVSPDIRALLMAVRASGSGLSMNPPAGLTVSLVNRLNATVHVSDISLSLTPPSFWGNVTYSGLVRPPVAGQYTGAYVLAPEGSVMLNYTLSGNVSIGSVVGPYYLSFNTSYGRAYYALIGKAT
ncbi:MAG: hypothetical protein M1321_02760 [Candidatus Marsarchaeota archaeon]|nr:hypothetical protein [Candidatus Marsarchaeota archaeon]